MVFEIKKYEDIVTDIVTNLVARNTELTDLNVGSVIRSLVEAYALELESESLNGLYQQIQEVYNATRITTATDGDLDELAKIVGVQRKSGTKSSTILTLKRTTPAANDFVIVEGATFSTQPTVEQNELRFVTTQDYTFKKVIANEAHEFVNGIYYYPLTERFYSVVNSVNGLVSSSPFTFVKDTDYKETKGYSGKITDIDTIDLVDNFENLTGWNNSADADSPLLDAINYRQGANSFSLGKSGTASNTFSYEHTMLTGVDLTNKFIHFKLRIEDITTLNKITTLNVYLGEDSSNYLKLTLSQSDLAVGWNNIFLDPSDGQVTGIINLNNLLYKKFEFVTSLVADTITQGYLNLDYLMFAYVFDYEGDIIEWIGQLPDDVSSFTAGYVPLSKEVEVTASEVGTAYNVASYKIANKISSIPNVTSVLNYLSSSGGESAETDDEMRLRITTASYAIGKATVDSIEQGLLTLDFINSANVDDMPLKVVSLEAHTFSTGTDLYQLNYEVAQNDSTLKVYGNSNSLNGGIDDVVTTITVNDAAGFLSSGYIIIDSEIISYSGVSVNDLTGCVRGQLGSIAASHVDTTITRQWFVKDADFIVNTESKIDWSGVSKPVDATSFNVDYTYRWLGHIEVFLIGPTTFSLAQQTTIVDKIIEYKAAGISYAWSTPTYINVNVTTNINLKSGYSFSSVEPEVRAAILQKLNSYSIGQNVYLSQLIDTIMNIEGVNYCEITTPTGTVVVDADEISKSGTVIINEI